MSLALILSASLIAFAYAAIPEVRIFDSTEYSARFLEMQMPAFFPYPITGNVTSCLKIIHHLESSTLWMI
jgi:hypothetical protein